MSPEDNKALVQRHFIDVVNACSLAAVDEIYSDDVVFYGPQGVLAGKAAVKDWIAGMHQAFEGFSAEVNLMVAEGDRVVARVTARAHHVRPFLGMPASQRRVVLPMFMVFRVSGDRIADLESIYDSRIFEEALGTPLPLMQKL
jgi:steroid delta-isomerase-like uncharacterized protein